jgi:hypothetical protein
LVIVRKKAIQKRTPTFHKEAQMTMSQLQRLRSRHFYKAVLLSIGFSPGLFGCDPSVSGPTSGGTVSNPAPSAAAAGSANTAALTPAMDFVQRNQSADTELHLLARKVINNETEVLSFYEPTPGHIIAVGAGRPSSVAQSPLSKDVIAAGHTSAAAAGRPGAVAQLRPSKDVMALWDGLKSGETMPQALLDAIARQQAGVGREQFQSFPPNAPESLASVPSLAAAEPAVAPATLEPTPTGDKGIAEVKRAVVNTGYCDTQWKSDFPTNLVGPNTSVCAASGDNGPYVANWTAPNTWSVAPYNSGAGCTCSCRTAVAAQRIHMANGDYLPFSNNWENFVSVCPVQYSASVSVSASNWNHTWTVSEDNYLWLEDTGTVSCFFTTCTSTNDIGYFDVTINSQTLFNDGIVNDMWNAYGP